MRNRYLLGSLMIAVIGFVGCVQTTPDVVVLNQDPIAKFQQDTAALGGNLQLESEIRNLFTNANTNDGVLFVYPISNYTTQIKLKSFGQYIQPTSTDRFSGYHTADDVEVDDKSAAVPVYALTNVTVVQKSTISGYGGVVIASFEDGGTTYHALYGHLDLNTVTANVGDVVLAGMKLGELGDDASEETDGERKHLHFGIYPFTGTELVAGYVDSDSALVHWVDPSQYLRERGAILP